jgi:hypothetical protein
VTAPAAARRTRLASPRTATVLTWLMVVLLGILGLEGALGGKLSPHDLGPAASLTTLIVVIGAVGLVVARHQPAARSAGC